jgi:hypothetical protein
VEASEPTPIACTLDAAGAQSQLDEWGALRPHCRRTEATVTGTSLWYEPEADAPLRAVAAKEADCCGFLRLEVRPDAGLVRLDITSDRAEARPVIELLARAAGGRAAG